ncbi:site-specific integrase, partial [Cupriavidus basilensis]
ARGLEWESQAGLLASASAHWLRHTAGSHMTDQQVDLRFVRDNFGHASIATTSAYLHTEDDARHEATQERHRIGWKPATAAPAQTRPEAVPLSPGVGASGDFSRS